MNWDLVLAHADQVRNIAWNVLRTLPSHANVRHEDLVSAGLMGLIQAAQRFDAEARPGVIFPGFAKHRIHGAIFDYLRKSERDRNAMSLDADPALFERDRRFAVAEQEIEPEQHADYLWLWRLIKQLPTRTQEILKLYYGEHDLNDNEIGVRLGLSGSRIATIRKNALVRVRQLARKGPGTEGVSAA